jgi:NADPH:quinone reductase-like Zn-dependent oxidoreductase
MAPGVGRIERHALSTKPATTQEITMKAIVYHRYGSPDVLQLEEVEKPTPGDDEVLVKVHASSVNDWDWGLLRGKPFANRMMFGLLKPKKVKILGLDIAGLVEAVGKNVAQLAPGDEVFGDISGSGFGGFAEYVCARENTLTLKPASMTFEQAAAMPHVGVLGLQGLRYKGEVQPGQKVLMNGAGGGLGTLVIQMAKSIGAEVTGVDSGMKLDMLRSLGADHVIDYTQEDFTRNGQRYDRIIDVAAYRSTFAYKRALAPGGVYGAIGGSSARIMQTLFLGPFIALFGSKKMGVVMLKPN